MTNCIIIVNQFYPRVDIKLGKDLFQLRGDCTYPEALKIAKKLAKRFNLPIEDRRTGQILRLHKPWSEYSNSFHKTKIKG